MTRRQVVFLTALGIVVGCGAGAVLHDTFVGRAEAKSITKWEHICVDMRWEDMNGQPLRKELGEAGWEMVSAAAVFSEQPTKLTKIFTCYKRPLQGPVQPDKEKPSAVAEKKAVPEPAKPPPSKEDKIRETMTQSRPKVMACLAKAYEKGDVTVEVSVDATGVITGLDIQEDLAESVKICISQALVEIQLPSAPDPYTFSFVYKQKK